MQILGQDSHTQNRVFQKRNTGLNLLEVSVSLSVITLACLGVMASLSTGAFAFRESNEFHESQLLVQEVIEELNTVSFDTLLSFDGQYVNSEDGEYRADIGVDYVSQDLIRVHVSCTLVGNGDLESEAVRLFSNRS